MAEKSPSKSVKSAKSKSSKGKKSAALDESKATIKKLRSTIDKLETKNAKLEKKVAALKADPKKAPTVKPAAVAAVDTRTVAQLRAEAKAKGVAGYSRLRKDQLLAAL